MCVTALYMILKNKTWNVIVATEVSLPKKLYPTCWVLVRPQYLIYPSLSRKEISQANNRLQLNTWGLTGCKNPVSNEFFLECMSGSLKFSKFAMWLAQYESTSFGRKCVLGLLVVTSFHHENWEQNKCIQKNVCFSVVKQGLNEKVIEVTDVYQKNLSDVAT